MAYEPYQQRVIAERDEIRRRMIVLQDFITPSNPVYAALREREKYLAQSQEIVMRAYLSLLDERISLYNREGDA
jgi:hypothetical protein